MLVVIPYCVKDASQAKLLLEFIDDLGGCRKHPCLLMSDGKITEQDNAQIRKLAKLAFKTVSAIKEPYAIKLSKTGDAPWPVGANWGFYTCALYISMTTTSPFLWLEPDCVPLCSGWLDKIEAEYQSSQKPFLGPVIETQNKSFKPQYLNGTSVYPANAIKYFHVPMVEFLKGAGNAFDVAGSPQTVPNCHFSGLIQHGYTDTNGINHWGTHPNTPLVFKTAKEAGDGDNVITPAAIRSETVLFHPCKNGSLIELLRKAQEQERVAA